MEIVKKLLTDLHEPQKNIRRHTDKQLKEYVRSLEMFGQIKPIVADENGEIIAGNGLFEALRIMGAEYCDCYIVSGLTEKQKKKLMLADNRVYELGVTDTTVFDEILRELGGDIDVPGWDEDLLEMLTSSISETNDIVENYGVYEPEAIAAVTAKEPNAQPAQKENQNHSPCNETTDVPSTGNYIICPKCGERICL